MFAIKMKYWGMKGFTVKFSQGNDHLTVKYLRHTGEVYKSGVVELFTPQTMETIDFLLVNWKAQHDDKRR